MESHNCACPGCCYIIPMSEKYCSKHVTDARHQRPVPIVHVDQYQSTFPKYETTVGHPEHGKNKI